MQYVQRRELLYKQEQETRHEKDRAQQILQDLPEGNKAQRSKNDRLIPVIFNFQAELISSPEPSSVCFGERTGNNLFVIL